MQWLHTLFGAPAYVARQHTLRGDAHALMRVWIAAAEALLRHLLVIEAAACAPAPARRARAPRTRQRRLVAFSPDASDDWRVHFRCVVQADRRLPAGKPAPGKAAPRKHQNTAYEAGAPRFYSAWPLALRYEALIRVFNNPAPYARRLARKLRALPKRAQALLRFPEGAIDKIGAESVVALREAAQRALAAPNTS